MKERNIGILTSISWNSNEWMASATKEDLNHSGYDYVKENHHMHEDLNFAHEILPVEEDGTFIAYSPMLRKLPSKTECADVQIVFFRSLNYKTKDNLIVGFYAFPYIDNYERLADNDLYKKYDWGNVAAFPEHIVLFDIPLPINEETVVSSNFLPKGKKLGHQGFNYLKYQNVLRILDKATSLNPLDKKLSKIKFDFLTDTAIRG